MIDEDILIGFRYELFTHLESFGLK
jgi:hypothetical protein